MTLMPHQRKASQQLLKILAAWGIAYLAGELRTGKTITSLMTAQEYLLKRTRINVHHCRVVIITSKKAISSISQDYADAKVVYDLQIVNFEGIFKLSYRPDFLIIDEAHRLGAYPKPGKITKFIRAKFGNIPTILMSGTPSPESYSQLFHQLWVTMQGVWKQYVGFYKWAHDYVDIKQEFIGMGRLRNDYSHAKKTVMQEFQKICVTMTQQQAGFDGKIVEEVHNIALPEYLYNVINMLKKHRVYEDSKAVLMADTGARLFSMVHQLSSGTIIDNEGNSFTINDYKAQYIKQTFKGRKIAIFYVYKQEGEMLRKVFPLWTDDPEDFNKNNHQVKFICQVRSGREGVNLSTADDIIFLNISHSAVSYWQARARSQSFKGGDKKVHWLFSDKGIEKEIYEVVTNKKDYTLNHFEQHVRIENSRGNNKASNLRWIQSNPATGNKRGRLARFISVKGGKDTVDRGKKTKRNS